MTLDAWLTQSGLSEKEFGEMVGRRQASINRYRNGLQIPNRKTVHVIAKITSGKVKAKDFYGQVKPRRRPRRAAAEGRGNDRVGSPSNAVL